ncbi:MAG: efflux RND transporter permease subunit, partial [Candidatus Omnitrophota bacterium]|nr:efflux RND transporter permease subunit [Candidatus Omnitrophota bacterium]
QPLGSIKQGLTDYTIRLLGEFTKPEEINEVVLGKRDGKYVYLRDIARVEDGFKEITMQTRVNKNPGLMLTIQKQAGVNTIEVVTQVKKKIAALLPSLPPDVKMHLIFDNSEDIIDSLDALKSSVWLGIGLVILVVWFFLRQFFGSLIIALTIPFSLLIAFIYLFLSNKTINVISLFSLAITAGMVVDNAIVVVDNVYRYLERNKSPVEAAIYGTTEMSLAIAASTFTTVVVFLPLLFVRGVIGIMFGELAIIVIVTLLSSLFTAVTFTPMLCAKWLRLKSHKHKAGKLRLRPVLMFIITILAGLLPLALSRGQGSEIWQPLGITMIGGLSISTLITMLFVPTLYAAFSRE